MFSTHCSAGAGCHSIRIVQSQFTLCLWKLISAFVDDIVFKDIFNSGQYVAESQNLEDILPVYAQTTGVNNIDLKLCDGILQYFNSNVEIMPLNNIFLVTNRLAYSVETTTTTTKLIKKAN